MTQSDDSGITSSAVLFRPHRHLCPEADMRDAMDEGEFWAHVLLTARHDEDYFDHSPALGPLTEPCGECGSIGACAWDAEGRPLIHPVNGDDE